MRSLEYPAALTRQTFTAAGIRDVVQLVQGVAGELA